MANSTDGLHQRRREIWADGGDDYRKKMSDNGEEPLLMCRKCEHRTRWTCLTEKTTEWEPCRECFKKPSSNR